MSHAVATLGQRGEAFVLRGTHFERWEMRGGQYLRTHRLRVERDDRHQRFHFEPAALRRVPAHWITALDALARRVLR